MYDLLHHLQVDYPSHSLPRPSKPRKRVGVTCLVRIVLFYWLHARWLAPPLS